MKVFIATEVAGCRPLALDKLTLSQISFKNVAKITTLCFREWLINVVLKVVLKCTSGFSSNEKKQIAKFHYLLKTA